MYKRLSEGEWSRILADPHYVVISGDAKGYTLECQETGDLVFWDAGNEEAVRVILG